MCMKPMAQCPRAMVLSHLQDSMDHWTENIYISMASLVLIFENVLERQQPMAEAAHLTYPMVTNQELELEEEWELGATISHTMISPSDQEVQGTTTLENLTPTYVGLDLELPWR